MFWEVCELISYMRSDITFQINHVVFFTLRLAFGSLRFIIHLHLFVHFCFVHPFHSFIFPIHRVHSETNHLMNLLQELFPGTCIFCGEWQQQINLKTTDFMWLSISTYLNCIECLIASVMKNHKEGIKKRRRKNILQHFGRAVISMQK